MRPDLLARSVGGVLLALSICEAPAASSNVNMINSSFQPATLTISVGDTVTWTMRDSGTQHNSASDTGIWSGPLLSAPGQTWSRTFTSAGTFPYRCDPHASFMRGTIIVKAAANTPPTVSITNPANGAVLTAPASVTINANATDSDGSVASVEFFDGIILLGVDPSSPYSVTATLSAGSHTLTAKATDNAGVSTTSAAVTVTVTTANSPPVVQITSPANGATFTAPATLTIQATATDDGTVAQVEFLVGATLVGADTTAPYSVTVTNLPAGNYALTARATDNQRASTTSAQVNINVNAAVAAPSKLSGSTRLSNGQFQFTIAGTTGKSYTIQASQDLNSWIVVQTIIATSDTFSFADANAAGLARRFYRVVTDQ